MARAEVKITMTTEQFQLMMDTLKATLNETVEQIQDTRPTDPAFEVLGQQQLAIEALIRQLK